MHLFSNEFCSKLIAITLFSINKSNGVAVQLKLKARTVLQRVQDALELPSLWPYAVECCASTVRALLPQVKLHSGVADHSSASVISQPFSTLLT